MFGMTLVGEKYLTLLESELQFYRNKFDAERERADRLHDQLLTVHGLEPATVTMINENEAKRAQVSDALGEQQRQLSELYAESVPEMLGDDEYAELGLPPDLAQEAAVFSKTE